VVTLQVWYKENKKDVSEFEKQMRRKVHYVIKPEYLWGNIVRLARTQHDELLNTLQKGFKYIEEESFQSNFQGLFSEINLASDKLGRKRVIVSGAASGMGEGIARLFAREGAAVALVDVQAAKGVAVAQQIRAEGGRAIFIECDVAKETAVRASIERTEKEFGGLQIIVNCAGMGARELTPDPEMEPHRGQVAIVPRLDLQCAIVCDDPPLMYAIPRASDCVFGGTNSVNGSREPDTTDTNAIVRECSRVVNIEVPRVIATRVGLRPYRKSGVRLESEKLRDGRAVIHNYGHGGSGFTLSWGCADDVLRLFSRLTAS